MIQTIQSIERTTTVSAVVKEIRNKIILQEYPARYKITEESLSSQYGISRGSIRRALQILENEGLISTLPNGRKIVVGITEKFVNDLYETRSILECEAVRIILGKPVSDFAQLAEITYRFHDLDNSEDPAILTTRSSVNANFHRVLVQMSGNRPLLQCWSTIEPLVTAFASFNSMVNGTETHGDLYVDSHEKILQMLISKDPDTLEYLVYHTKIAAKNETLAGLQRLKCL